MKSVVLFVCLGNSGRSQMAEAFFEQTRSEWIGKSAGIRPDKEIHQLTVEALGAVGIDVSRRRPKKLTGKMLAEADRIVVMDFGVLSHIARRYLPKTESWRIEPLLGKNRAQVEAVRDKIRKKVERLSKELESHYS